MNEENCPCFDRPCPASCPLDGPSLSSQLSDGPEYGDGPEFAGYEERAATPPPMQLSEETVLQNDKEKWKAERRTARREDIEREFPVKPWVEWNNGEWHLCEDGNGRIHQVPNEAITNDPQVYNSLEEWAEKNSTQSRIFETGATRDSSENKLDYEGFLSPIALRRYAEYMHTKRKANVPPGEAMRSSDNWQKGIPRDEYLKSTFRHFMEWWLIHDGYEAHDEKGNVVDLEEVLSAILFNTQGYLHEHLKEQLNKAG